MESLSRIREEFVSGNTSKLKELYHDYHDDVIRIVLSKKLCGASEAESIFSESLLIFYDNVVSGKITEVSSIKNYLVGICVNSLRNELSAKFRFQDKVNEVRTVLYDNGYDAPKKLHKEELKSICYKAMSELSDKCKSIIEGYYLDRLSMKEIAQKMNLSSGDVAKTLKSRCFKSLMKIVQKQYNEKLI